MKTQFNIPRQPKPLRDGQRPIIRNRPQLTTDYGYHPAAGDLRTTGREFKVATPGVTPSFRDLSTEFLKAESTRSYAIEASLFAIIVAISAWPIFLMAQAMGQIR